MNWKVKKECEDNSSLEMTGLSLPEVYFYGHSYFLKNIPCRRSVHNKKWGWGFDSWWELGIFLLTVSRLALIPSSHPSNGYWGLFPWGMRLTTHLFLVQR
jgi:hypothetical protein